MQYGSGLTATAGVLNRQGQTPAPSPAIASLNAPRMLDVPRGGIMKSVTNTTTNTQNRNRSVNIATAHFNMTDGMSVADVAEEFSLAMPG